MKILSFVIICGLLSTAVSAQPPGPTAFAYSRKTISGIKPGPGQGIRDQPNRNPFPDSFYLYVRVPAGTTLTIDGIWLKGKYFTAVVKSVDVPVLVDHDNLHITKPKQDTLVRNGEGDVYEIILGAPASQEYGDDVPENLKTKNEALFLLRCNGTPCYTPIRHIQPLHPNSAM
jgi:hypothetical protein